MPDAERLPALVSTAWLEARLLEPGLRIVDVRWRLGAHGAGRELHAVSRIPGAAFLDVDEDLSDIGDPRRGRHPLPPPERVVETLARAGIGKGDRVVAYDDAGGTHAARLWWMMRWLGGEAAVLDGGFVAWTEENRPVERGPVAAPAFAARPLLSRPDRSRLVDKAFVVELSRARLVEPQLLDARAAERYRGEAEPIDPRPGHIPGARNLPTADLLDGPRFRAPAALRARFEALGVREGADVIASCGSGVTACQLLVALEHAGLPGGRLYAGSWSEWSNDPALPAALGPSPWGAGR